MVLELLSHFVNIWTHVCRGTVLAKKFCAGEQSDTIFAILVKDTMAEWCGVGVVYRKTKAFALLLVGVLVETMLVVGVMVGE